MSTRIDQLEKFLTEDPHDPFNLYALALEYQKSDAEKALTLFHRLTNEHPQYVPTYYHFGKLLLEVGERSGALKTFEAGMHQARSQHDSKALHELQAAYQEAEYDE